MTLAKAQACASAIIGAGFNAVVHRNADETWTVRAQADTFAIDSAQVSALVASQGVSGKVALVEFA